MRIVWLPAILAFALALPGGAALAAKERARSPAAADAFASALSISRAGSPDAAVAVWSRLARENPGSPEIRNNLAVALAKVGRRADARRVLDRANRLQPKYASIQHNLESREDDWLLIDTLPRQSATRQVAMTRQEADALLGLSDAEPTAAPAASAAPAPSPAAAPVVRDLPGALHHWVSAWQARDVDAYLAAYHPDFAVPSGADRGAWESERRQRILAKKWIRIGLLDTEWSNADDGNTATVRFTQDYEAPSLRERSRKQLTWRRTEQGWRIADERTLGR